MELKIRDGRGEHWVKVRADNLQKVKDFFIKNPGSTQKECAEAVGLSPSSIATMVKILTKE